MTRDFAARVIAELTRIAIGRHDQPCDVIPLRYMLNRYPEPLVVVDGKMTVPRLSDEGNRVLGELVATLGEQM